MASSIKNIWWITPLQCFATIGAAVNCGTSTTAPPPQRALTTDTPPPPGASASASPIAMPLFLHAAIPALHRSAQIVHLLHTSEFLFPPLNALCGLAHLAALVACYLHRRAAAAAAAKLPWLAAAFALGLAVTAWSLSVMVPINAALRDINRKLQRGEAGPHLERELVAKVLRWQRMNYGTHADRRPGRLRC